jgi:hypothetical protein
MELELLFSTLYVNMLLKYIFHVHKVALYLNSLTRVPY